MVVAASWCVMLQQKMHRAEIKAILEKGGIEKQPQIKEEVHLAAEKLP